MTDTNCFDDLSRIVEHLDMLGVPVVKDTHVYEREVEGKTQTVAEMTVVLDADRSEDFELDDEDVVREIVRDEMDRLERQMNGKWVRANDR